MNSYKNLFFLSYNPKNQKKNNIEKNTKKKPNKNLI